MQPFWGHIHHAKLVIDAANMQKTFRNDPKQHDVDQSDSMYEDDSEPYCGLCFPFCDRL